MSAWLFIIAYFALCIIYFCGVQRPLFCLYNRNSDTRHNLSPGMFLRLTFFGLKTDVVGAVYLTAIPALAVIIASFTPGGNIAPFLRVYNVVIALVAGLAATSDMLLYRFWQSKIDASALSYLKSAEGAVASVSPLFIAGALLLWMMLSGLFYAGAEAVVALTVGHHPFVAHGVWEVLATIVAGLLTLAAMFAMLRGLGHRPKTPSVSFFSTDMFLNHCAVNPEYNFIFSISSAGSLKKKFRKFPDDLCSEKADAFYPVGGTPQKQLLTTRRPDILLIIWESLSARHVEELGGQPGVLTEFDRLSREGVLFTHVDAGNIRTDRGLVCLLSGYLCPPAECVIKYSRKLPGLPSLPRTLGRCGYTTAAWHGGDLTFYHMKDYYMAAGFDSLRHVDDFPADAPRCKWGVHDGYIFDSLEKEIEMLHRSDDRWFMTFQTLSSHEPFEVPDKIIDNDRIANAFAYTDRCFGRFIDHLKSTPAWDNMLVVVTGDHGFYHGGGIDRDRYPHIPLLLLGGAVKAPERIDTIMSQTDIAATLLGQMDIGHSDYPFSRDVLADTYTDRFSFHTHQTGFIVRDDRGFTEYDIASDSAISGNDPSRCERGCVSLQQLYNDLSKR